MENPGGQFGKRASLVIPLLVWLTLAVLSTTLSYSLYRLEDRNVQLWRVAWWQGSLWLLWATATPFILRLCRRFRLDKAHWRQSLWIHFAASIAVVLAISFGLALLRYPVPLLADMPLTFASLIMNSFYYFHTNLFVYWAIVGVASALDFYHRWQTEQVEGARLREQLAQAQLQALQMQLHPHFLFNTLHAIGTLVEDEPRLARQMLVRLGDFLRLTLQENGAEMVSLGRELEFVRTYLAIEELRFQDRLKVNYDIAPEALAARVPYLILQPLVENAIRHGLAARAGGGALELNAARRNGHLRLEVRDDGKGFARLDEGVGLKNTRQRLAQIYGEKAELSLTRSETGLTIAAVELPFNAKS